MLIKGFLRQLEAHLPTKIGIRPGETPVRLKGERSKAPEDKVLPVRLVEKADSHDCPDRIESHVSVSRVRIRNVAVHGFDEDRAPVTA